MKALVYPSNLSSKERNRLASKAYRERIKRERPEVYEERKNRISDKWKKWRKDNPDESRAKSKLSHQRVNESPEKKANELATRRSYHKRMMEERKPSYINGIKKNSKIQYAKNKEKYLRHQREFRKRKLKIDCDPQFILATSCRKTIWGHLARRNKVKSDNSIELLGCSIKYYTSYIEDLFIEGMTWENYGKKDGWEIDHIIPIAHFDLTIPSEQYKCFHFSNTMPMWREDNRAKRDSLTFINPKYRINVVDMSHKKELTIEDLENALLICCKAQDEYYG